MKNTTTDRKKLIKLNRLICARDQFLSGFVDNYQPINETLKRIKAMMEVAPNIKKTDVNMLRSICGLFITELAILKQQQLIKNKDKNDNSSNRI